MGYSHMYRTQTQDKYVRMIKYGDTKLCRGKISANHC